MAHDILHADFPPAQYQGQSPAVVQEKGHQHRVVKGYSRALCRSSAPRPYSLPAGPRPPTNATPLPAATSVNHKSRDGKLQRRIGKTAPAETSSSPAGRSPFLHRGCSVASTLARFQVRHQLHRKRSLSARTMLGTVLYGSAGELFGASSGPERVLVVLTPNRVDHRARLDQGDICAVALLRASSVLVQAQEDRLDQQEMIASRRRTMLKVPRKTALDRCEDRRLEKPWPRSSSGAPVPFAVFGAIEPKSAVQMGENRVNPPRIKEAQSGASQLCIGGGIHANGCDSFLVCTPFRVLR